MSAEMSVGRKAIARMNDWYGGLPPAPINAPAQQEFERLSSLPVEVKAQLPQDQLLMLSALAYRAAELFSQLETGQIGAESAVLLMQYFGKSKSPQAQPVSAELKADVVRAQSERAEVAMELEDLNLLEFHRLYEQVMAIFEERLAHIKQELDELDQPRRMVQAVEAGEPLVRGHTDHERGVLDERRDSLESEKLQTARLIGITQGWMAKLGDALDLALAPSLRRIRIPQLDSSLAITVTDEDLDEAA